MKKRPASGRYLGHFTKSDNSTIKTIPNCAKLHDKKRRKNIENLLHGVIFYGILKQNRVKKHAVLYISTMHL